MVFLLSRYGIIGTMKWGAPILPIVAGLLLASTAALAAQPVLVPRFNDSNGWLHVRSAGLGNHVHSLQQTRQITNQAGVLIETSYYWPPPLRGSTVSYTAPLVDWVQTRITGLTVSPIVLTNVYAQTYCPGRHDFFEEIIFEPQLDPGVSPALLQELQVPNIQFLYSTYESGESAICALGLDGTIRRLP